MEKGYDETTVLDIVANLNGLTRGAFYHHFKSKEAVLDALFNSLGGGDVPFETAMKADVPNGLERLKMVFKMSLRSNVAEEEIIALTNMVFALLEQPRFFAERHSQILQSARSIESIIEEGMADGSIRKGSARAYAELVLLLTNYWMMPKLFPGSDEDLNARGELMIEILNGIGFPVIDNEIKEAHFTNVETFDL